MRLRWSCRFVLCFLLCTAAHVVASAPTTLGRFTTAGLPLLFRGLWRGAVRGLRRRLASG